MKILFIGPNFNGYQKSIASTIRKSGKYKTVDYISDCPLWNIGFFATICNLFPSQKNKIIKKYNEFILRKIRTESYDIVFIIRGEFLDSNIIKLAREGNKNLKIIVYQWDSIHNNTNAQHLIKIADEAYTFDYEDSKNFSLKYVPLFYSWEEAGIKRINISNPTIDIVSIGGYRSHRMPFINIMKKVCERKNLKYKFHSFMRLLAYIKNKKKLGINLSDINFSKISYKRYYSILQNSKAVLDIQSPTQSGLTMRTMETLSLGKKLITTNANIKKEQFYNRNNIYIINAPEDLLSNELDDFLKLKFKPEPGLLSLSEWLKQVNVL